MSNNYSTTSYNANSVAPAGYGVDSPSAWTGANTVAPKVVGQAAFTLVDIMASSPVYVCTADRDVEWNGNLYRAFPFSVSGIKNNPQGSPEPLRIGISNVSRSFRDRFMNLQVQGKDMILRRAHWIAGSSFSPPFIAYAGWVEMLQVKEEKQTSTIFIELKNEFLRWDASIPRNTFSAACNWSFKSGTPGCQYTGAASICDRSWESCKALQNTDRFRGFRIIPSLEDKQFWWGRSAAW